MKNAIRVWDNDHKQYWSNERYGVIPCITPMGMRWFEKSSQKLITDIEMWGCSQKDRFIFEKSTDITIFNEVGEYEDVYEGDIIKIDGEPHYVAWSDTMHSYIAIGKDLTYYGLDILNCERIECILVGNLHQNLELWNN